MESQRLLLSAAALSALALAPLAQATAPALDSTPIESALRPMLDNLEVGVLLRTYFANTDEDLGLEVNGFGFHDIDIWAQTQLDGFDARVSVDASLGVLVLEDAYVSWRKDERFGLRLGNFKPRVFFTNAVDPDRLLFNDRTVLGEFFDFWDTGVEATGRLTENFDYHVSLTNGDNGIADDSLIVMRGEWTVHGSELAPREGSRGLEDTKEIQLGAVIFDDTGDDEMGFGLDALVHQGNWTAQFEVMTLDDGLGGPAFLDAVPVPLSTDSTPWALTGSYLADENFQIAGRLQDTDNATDTRIWGVGVNWFPDDTPLTVVAEVGYFEGDQDGLVFQVGTNLGAWRPR